MIDVARIVKDFCLQNKISIKISFDVPSGYESTNGMYDETK